MIAISWVTRTAAVCAVAVTSVLFAGAAASAAPGTVNTASLPLTVRASASTSAKAVGTVKDGARITIDCQTTGTSVKGKYGTSKIWDHVPAKKGYVADSYIYTGSDSFVAPECGGKSSKTCSAKGIHNTRSCAQAVAWAKSKLKKGYNSDYYARCDHVVGLAYGRSASGHASAKQHWGSTPKKYRHSGKNIPAGGLAFFSGGRYGHVAISTGDGRLISNDIHGKGKLRYTTISEIQSKWGDKYLGWTNPWF
jgi:uncharacterized protein YraI